MSDRRAHPDVPRRQFPPPRFGERMLFGIGFFILGCFAALAAISRAPFVCMLAGMLPTLLAWAYDRRFNP